MKAFFIAFALTAMLMMVTSALVGAMVRGEAHFDLHFALGLATTLFICFCHCVVFTYFMATSKMIGVAVEDAALEAGWTRRAMRYKMRAYRVLMPAVAAALVAAVSGAWATNEAGRSDVHLALVMASMAFQLIAFRAEYAAITDNGALMDDVFREHERARHQNSTAHPPRRTEAHPNEASTQHGT
jgi:hypothetical protein